MSHSSWELDVWTAVRHSWAERVRDDRVVLCDGQIFRQCSWRVETRTWLVGLVNYATWPVLVEVYRYLPYSGSTVEVSRSLTTPPLPSSRHELMSLSPAISRFALCHQLQRVARQNLHIGLSMLQPQFTMWVKKQCTWLLIITSTDFQNSFTDRFPRKLSIQSITGSSTSPQLCCYATLRNSKI